MFYPCCQNRNWKDVATNVSIVLLRMISVAENDQSHLRTKLCKKNLKI